MKSLRVRAKHEIARKRGQVTAQTDQFTLSLDTRYTPDVGQVLNIRKKLERGQWESEFINACFEHIGPTETIFEVGTWIGPYSVILSKYVVPGGRLIGFEPDPVAFRQCVINLNINNITNAFILPLAVSNRAGTVELFTNRIFGNSGSSIVTGSSASAEPGSGKVDVPAVTLDEMTSTLALNPTTVKMDIEGAEDLALQGAVNTISRNGVKVLLEIHSEHLKGRGKSANSVLAQLADLGKTIYFLENDARYPYRLNEKMDPARPIDLPPFRIIAL